MRGRPIPLAGRVVAVTGGARGIGAAIACACAQRGARVAVGDLDLADAERAAAAFDGAGFALDVTDTSSVAAFLDAVEERLGPLDVLVCNAGVMWVGPFADEPEATALRQFDVNVHGVIRALKLAAPRMRARGAGHLVTVASAASKITPPGETAYAATKHAVYGYCAGVREELRGSGVDVSVVMPAVVSTELAAGTHGGRGARTLSADAVGAAVAAAIERPRFEVYVPRSIAPLARLLALLPQRGRDALHRTLVPDQIKRTDQSARAQYEHERFRA